MVQKMRKWCFSLDAAVWVVVPISLYSKYLFSIILTICGNAWNYQHSLHNCLHFKAYSTHSKNAEQQAKVGTRGHNVSKLNLSTTSPWLLLLSTWGLEGVSSCLTMVFNRMSSILLYCSIGLWVGMKREKEMCICLTTKCGK